MSSQCRGTHGLLSDHILLNPRKRFAQWESSSQTFVTNEALGSQGKDEEREERETFWRSILTSRHTDFFRPCDGSRTEQSRAIAQVWTRQRKKLPETSYIVLYSLSLLWKKGESLLHFTRQSGKGIEQMLGNHCPVFLCPFPFLGREKGLVLSRKAKGLAPFSYPQFKTHRNQDSHKKSKLRSNKWTLFEGRGKS